MQISLFQPFGYSEIGGRANNEDAIYPNPTEVIPTNRLFIVCDGVGGAEKGEIASELAINSFAKFFQDNQIQISDKETIHQAVEFAERAFDEYIISHPASRGMATTVTLLHLHERGATIAHIGDSRVYLIRNGQILHQTKDHSFAMELYEAGFISIEQAKTHPRKNEITRALQGKNVRDTKAEVSFIEELLPNDVFVLCTDGVNEKVDETVIASVVGSPNYQFPETIGKAFIELSIGQTRDNFSAYIVKIKDVTEVNSPETDSRLPKNIDLTTNNKSYESVETETTNHYQKPKEKSKLWLWILATLLFLGSLAGGYYLYKNKAFDNLFKENKIDKKKNEVEIEEEPQNTEPNLLETTPAKQDSNKIQIDTPQKATTSGPPLKQDVEKEEDKKEENKIDKKTLEKAHEKLKNKEIKENKPKNEINEKEVTAAIREWNSYLSLVEEKGKLGLKNGKGKVMLDVKYEEIQDEGKNKNNKPYHWVKENKKYRLIYLTAHSGIKVSQNKFDEVKSINQNKKQAEVILEGKEKVVNLYELFAKAKSNK